MAYIKLLNQDFSIVDVIENISVVDSFVRKNKLLPPKVGAKPGHGEARLYVGPQTSDNRILNFFEGFTSLPKCFFLKTDFLKYLNDSKFEYENQEQKYYKNIKGFWEENFITIKNFTTDLLEFIVEDARGIEDEGRFYIRSNDFYWKIMREIALPRITYISILKLKSSNNEFMFYFNIFIDYHFDSNNHPALITKTENDIEKDKTISKKQKEVIYQARIGQGKFREGLLEQMYACPITEVTDERILIASHIKPWAKSNDKEKTDPFNGIIFTPTYDRMFDQGFITFMNDGTILISPYISPLNRKKLNLAPNKKYDIKSKGREKYLEYHRTNIFKA